MTNVPKGGLVGIGGVWSILSIISGWSAEERGSETIEPLDLVRAIYIVDLEHVAALWNDWEGFERFISNVVLSDGRHAGYTNRTLYLIQTYLAAMENKGQFMALGKRSKVVHEIVVSAKQVAGERTGNDEPPSSRDLLYCVCAHQPDLSRALQESGLDLGKLVTSVRRQS